jgi:hypothetical protein
VTTIQNASGIAATFGDFHLSPGQSIDVDAAQASAVLGTETQYEYVTLTPSALVTSGEPHDLIASFYQGLPFGITFAGTILLLHLVKLLRMGR